MGTSKTFFRNWSHPSYLAPSILYIQIRCLRQISATYLVGANFGKTLNILASVGTTNPAVHQLMIIRDSTPTQPVWIEICYASPYKEIICGLPAYHNAWTFCIQGK